MSPIDELGYDDGSIVIDKEAQKRVTDLQESAYKLAEKNKQLKAEVARLTAENQQLKDEAAESDEGDDEDTLLLEQKDAEVARLTAELAEHKGDGQHDHNFTYSAERDELRKAIDRVIGFLKIYPVGAHRQPGDNLDECLNILQAARSKRPVAAPQPHSPCLDCDDNGNCGPTSRSHCAPYRKYRGWKPATAAPNAPSPAQQPAYGRLISNSLVSGDGKAAAGDDLCPNPVACTGGKNFCLAVELGQKFTNCKYPEHRPTGDICECGHKMDHHVSKGARLSPRDYDYYQCPHCGKGRSG